MAQHSDMTRALIRLVLMHSALVVLVVAIGGTVIAWKLW